MSERGEDPTIRDKLEALVERLAAIEHARWAHWQKYVHKKGTRLADGSLQLPAVLVAQWESEIATPYERLSEKTKESDRQQVRQYLPVIAEALERDS